MHFVLFCGYFVLWGLFFVVFLLYQALWDLGWGVVKSPGQYCLGEPSGTVRVWDPYNHWRLPSDHSFPTCSGPLLAQARFCLPLPSTCKLAKKGKAAPTASGTRDCLWGPQAFTERIMVPFIVRHAGLWTRCLLSAVSNLTPTLQGWLLRRCVWQMRKLVLWRLRILPESAVCKQTH